MKHTIKGYVVWEQWRNETEGRFRFQCYKPSPEHQSNHYDVVLVCEHSFEVEIPDAFDPTPGLIASLEEQKAAARLKLARELMALDERISKLQALPFNAGSAS